MNVLLWIIQVALAVLYLSGGAYKVFKFDALANHMRALPRGGWRALGGLEMVGAILLVIPAVTPLAAAALTLETLALAGLYARYSLKLAATNPLRSEERRVGKECRSGCGRVEASREEQ